MESNGGKLIVEHTDEHDQGQWFCTAESEIGKDIKTFDIDILIPPQILQTQMSDSKKVLEGENLELYCDVEGNGSADRAWPSHWAIHGPNPGPSRGQSVDPGQRLSRTSNNMEIQRSDFESICP